MSTGPSIEPSKLRVKLAIAVAVVCCAAYFIVPSILPSDAKLAQDFAKDVFGGTFAAAIGFSLSFFFLGDYSDLQRMRDEILTELRARQGLEVQAVEAKFISHLLSEVRTNTTDYYFVGNSGSHFTSVTLPALAAAKRPVAIHAQILDPSDSASCDMLAKTRTIVTKSRDEVAQEILATIVICWLYAQEFPHLTFKHVSLRRSMVYYRFDIGSRSGMLTSEGRDEPAIVVREGGILDRVRLQVHQFLQLPSLRRLEMATTALQPAGRNLTDITEAQIIALFRHLDLKGFDTQAVHRAVLSRKNPYDRPRN